MSAKTKIVVLHMKELIYTAIFVGLGILLVVLLFFMFLPKLDIKNPIIRINTGFKGYSSTKKVTILPRIYHN